MFYDALKKQCPLPIDPFKALVGPRPIGWISTVSKAGVANLAPYSFFNAICDNPPMVMFSSGGPKDTLLNIRETGEFVCNIATLNLKDVMNVSSSTVDSEVDEFELAGITKAKSEMVAAPRVGGTPVALECKLVSIAPVVDMENAATPYQLVIGQVVGVFIDDDYIKDGRVNTARLNLLARHGYMDYSAAEKIFRIERPS